jgi:hypothetical protein
MISDKKAYIILLFIILSLSVIDLISFPNGHSWGGDFSLYIDQARTIVNGNFDDFFSNQQFRFENSTVMIGPVLYSWGFPLLLSPIYYFFGLNIFAFQLYVNLFFLLSLVIIFFIFKDDLKNSTNLLLVAIIAFNYWFFDFKDAVLSDFSFFFFSMLSIFLIKRFIIINKLWINDTVSYCLIGISIFFSYYVRETGIFLLPTLFVSQYIESRRESVSLKTFLFSDISKFIPYFIFSIIIVLLIFSSLSRSGYGRVSYEFLLLEPSTILLNIKYYFFLFSRFFPFLNLNVSAYVWHFDKFSLLIYLMMMSIVIFGLIRNIKKNYLYTVFCLLSLSFLLIFPHRQGGRFIIQLFPFFLYFLFLGLSKINILIEISEKRKPFIFRAVTVFGVALLLVSFFYISRACYQGFKNRSQVIDGPYSADSVELFNYIKQNTKKDDAVIFFKPRVLMLYTDRNSFAINRHNFSFDMAFNSPARYIAFSKKIYTSSDLRIQDFPEHLYCEFENNTFLLCDLRKK